MSKKISGPVNIARLEGSIGSVQKVIYLFMDVHLSYDKQTKCPDVAPNIKEYFNESFLELDKQSNIYDFFLEYRPHRYSVNVPESDEENYIHTVMRLFKESFNYDEQNNKVNIPGLYKKVRLHYIDVRDVLLYLTDYSFDAFNYWICQTIGLPAHMYNTIHFITGTKFEKPLTPDPESLHNVTSQFLAIKNDISIILNMFKSNANYVPNHNINLLKDLPSYNDAIFDEQETEKIRDKIKYVINKLMSKNTNAIIQKIIDQYISTSIIPLLENILTMLDDSYLKLNKLINDNPIIDEKIFDEIFLIQFPISDKIDDFASSVMDLYFLRRFLDKIYITNSIVYTGVRHSSNYVNILVNLFDFKITHISNSVNSIDNLNLLVKKIDPFKNSLHDSNLMTDLFLTNDINSAQFSDMATFPINFI